MKTGYKTTEFWQKLPLYLLAAYAIYKGYTPDEIKEGLTAVKSQLAEYREVLVVVAALAAPLIENMFYTKKRTDLKQTDLKESLE